MLNKITIKNYKSLENVSLTLRPFNVFIGPNNAGKSNIFDCLMFLSELQSLGAAALSRRGGFQYLVWGGELTRAISVDLCASLLDPKTGQEGRFSFQVEVVGDLRGLGYISSAKLARWEDAQWKTIAQEQPGKTVLWADGEERKIGLWNLEWLKLISPPFADYLRDWRVYNPVSSKMKEVVPVKKELILQPEGENFSRVLHTLHSSYRREFGEIEELARTGVPEVQELLTELTEQGGTYTTLKERGTSLRIPVWAMSDGTLRFLAHLVTLYTPQPPPLMAFEEPENFIHPRLHELLADVLRAASGKSQILVATHSPHFLDYRRFDLDDLVVVEKTDGMTHCKKLSKKRRADVKEALKVLTLGEMWYSGHLGGVPE